MSYSAFWEAGADSERRVTFVPRTIRAGKRLVVLAHSYGGATGGGEAFLDPVNNHATILAASLAEAGFLCVAPDLAYGSFGADPAPARLYDEWQAAITRFGCASDKVLVVGPSMGALVAHHFERAHPSKLGGFYGIAPGVDLNDLYTNDRAGVQAACGTAWGVTYPTPLPSTASPAANPAVLTGIPGRLAYSTADGVVLPATVTAFATATGMTTTVISSSLDHGDALIGAASVADISTFLVANGA